MKLKRLFLVLLICCVPLVLIILHSPRNMAHALGLNSNVDYCDIIVNSTIKYERFTLAEEDVDALYNILDQAEVQFSGTYHQTIYRSDKYLFHVYFYSETDQFEAFLIDEGGNVFSYGLRYQVLGDAKEALLSFFMKTFPDYYMR